MPSRSATGAKNVILGVTGASGALFARRTLQMLEADARVARIHLVISASGFKLLREELDLKVSKSSDVASRLAERAVTKTVHLLDSDIGANIASGSYPVDGMVVIPCSTACLAQIANGISSTLIERAADVCLKEQRKLILAIRDTPFSGIHLENMLRAHRAGAQIFPIIPSFYDRPRSIGDLATQFCCRVLDHLNLRQSEQFCWAGEKTGIPRKD